MDLRTKMRELDEVIGRAHCAIEREIALLEVLPNSRLRRRKQHRMRIMRAHLDRLRCLRSAIKTTRRPGSRLN